MSTHLTENRKGIISVLAIFICVCGILFGATNYLSLWRIGPDGLSLLSRTTPYWDFNNLWIGSKLAVLGQSDVLFDVETYRQKMDVLLGMDVLDQEWSYPPHTLLIGTPFSVLPIFYAYLLWTLGSIGMLYFAVRQFDIPKSVQIAIVLGPAIWINALFGQNGAFISALLIGGLAIAPKRPILAGVFFGIMTIKPHLGLLIPFCLIASRNWKTFNSASVTTLAMLAITTLAFGFDVWAGFLNYTQPMMRGIMEAPFLQDYQANSVTMFFLARSFGASVELAYALQLIFTGLAIGFAYWLWRPHNMIARPDKIALTCILVMLATPYGYTYDMCMAGAALGIVYARYPKMKFLPLVAFIWLFPLLNIFIVINTRMTFGGIVLLAAFAILLWTIIRSKAGPAQLLTDAKTA